MPAEPQAQSARRNTLALPVAFACARPCLLRPKFTAWHAHLAYSPRGGAAHLPSNLLGNPYPARTTPRQCAHA